MISRRILSERCALEEHKPNITKEKLLRKLNFAGDKSPETVIESMDDDGLSRMHEAYFMSYDQFCILIRWRSSTKPDGKGMQLVVEFLWLRSCAPPALCPRHLRKNCFSISCARKNSEFGKFRFSARKSWNFARRFRRDRSARIVSLALNSTIGENTRVRKRHRPIASPHRNCSLGSLHLGA